MKKFSELHGRKLSRAREKKLIATENELIFKTLTGTKSVYPTAEIAKEFKKNRERYNKETELFLAMVNF